MKKTMAFILACSVCIVLASCSKATVEESTDTTEPQTITTTEAATEPIIENTIQQPKRDNQKGSELKSAVLGALGNKDDAEISGEPEYGTFVYKYNRDASIVYANERDDENEQRAAANAQKLVDSISNLYNDELKLHNSQAKQIGTGENGIDSVQYQFYYINSQNQLLTIYADSDGEISYADCNFTW